MVASKDWIAQAANVFVKEVGVKVAMRITRDLQRIPAANKSVENTLIRLRNELNTRKTS